MKKIIIALLGATMLLTGCQRQPESERNTYIAYGRYYTCGEVITYDGNVWGYSQDIISEKASYDNEPVLALFDDNGTPDNIYDDEIYGVVLDREMVIHDEIKEALSKSFVVEHNGNVVSITQQ